MSIVRAKTGNVAVDRALLDVYRELRRATEPGAVVANNLGIGHLFTGSNLTTATARRYLAASSSGAIGSGLNTAGYLPVPPNFTRIVSMSLAVNAAGTGGGSVNFIVTVGGPNSESDSTLETTVLNTFSGIKLVEGNVPVDPGQAIRVAFEKAGTITSAQAGIGLFLVFQQA